MDEASDLDSDLDIDDLIDALGSHLRWRNAHPDLRDYWERRFTILCAALGLPVNLIEVAEGDVATAGLGILLEQAAHGVVDPPDPFSGFLEASLPVVELYQRFAPDLDELRRVHANSYRALARACLLALVPDLEDRACKETVLTEGGINRHPPDPHDYF